QHGVTEPSSDDQRQFAGILLAAIGSLTEARQLMVSQPNVDSAGRAIEPEPRAAIDSRVPHGVLAPKKLVFGTEVGGDSVTVQRNHGIGEETERQRSLLFNPPHWLPGTWQELPRDLMV